MSMNQWQKSRTKAQRRETRSSKRKKSVVEEWIGGELVIVLMIKSKRTSSYCHLHDESLESERWRICRRSTWFLHRREWSRDGIWTRWRWNNGREREDHFVEWKEYLWITSNEFSSERSIIRREWNSTLRWSLFWSSNENDDGRGMVDRMFRWKWVWDIWLSKEMEKCWSDQTIGHDRADSSQLVDIVRLFCCSVAKIPFEEDEDEVCVTDSLLFSIAAPSPSSIDEIEDRQRTTPLLDWTSIRPRLLGNGSSISTVPSSASSSSELHRSLDDVSIDSNAGSSSVNHQRRRTSHDMTLTSWPSPSSLWLCWREMPVIQLSPGERFSRKERIFSFSLNPLRKRDLKWKWC